MGNFDRVKRTRSRKRTYQGNQHSKDETVFLNTTVEEPTAREQQHETQQSHQEQCVVEQTNSANDTATATNCKYFFCIKEKT